MTSRTWTGQKTGFFEKPGFSGPGLESIHTKAGAAVKALKRLCDQLDPLLHERGRLAIVALLAAVSGLTFMELRGQLEMTDGNLSVHLQKLEYRGYVAIEKQFVGRKPQTTCRITPRGQEALTRYLDQLEAIVQQGRGQAAAGA